MSALFDLKDPKFWASVSAWMVPVSILAISVVAFYQSWERIDVANWIGAIAGPFAGLSGFLYIYATFQLQNLQFLTQKEQFFENTFYSLIQSYRTNVNLIEIEKLIMKSIHPLKNYIFLQLRIQQDN